MGFVRIIISPTKGLSHRDSSYEFPALSIALWPGMVRHIWPYVVKNLETTVAYRPDGNDGSDSSDRCR